MRQFGLKRGKPRPAAMIEQAGEPVVIAAAVKPTKKKMSAKEFRERVWAQNPRCHWCGCMTVLPATKRPKPNWATLDHLVSRMQAKQRRERQPGERRWVLACWACNARRNDEEQRETPIEELQIRSGRTPRDPVTLRCEPLTTGRKS